jgi:TRAP transporter TAXI family solute receptor
MFRFAVALTGLLAVAAGALAQTVGMAGTNSGFTSQASVAISKIVTEKTGVQMRSQAFGGSSVYVPLVSDGKIEFGLANELETEFAVTGTVIYDGRPQSDLQAVAVISPFRVALFARADSNIRTIGDLEGKRLPSGWSSQKIIGVLVDGVLANAGLTYDDVIAVPAANVVAGANDFAAGKVDAFFFVFGAGKVQETAAKVGGVRVLGVDPSAAAVERMRRHVPPAYAYEVEPSAANVGVEERLSVMAYDYLVLTSSKAGDDLVYQVTKALHESPAELAAAFPGLKLFDPAKMMKPLPRVGYHAGSERFYREIGAWK